MQAEFLLVYRDLNSNTFPSQVPCHKKKNCKNGGKTIIYLKDGPGSDRYRCECPKGSVEIFAKLVSSRGSCNILFFTVHLKFLQLFRDLMFNLMFFHL
jgi:hypothetical protein